MTRNPTQSLRALALHNSSVALEREITALVREIVQCSAAGTTAGQEISNAYAEHLKKIAPNTWRERLALESIYCHHNYTLEYAVAGATGEPWLERALAANLECSPSNSSAALTIAKQIRHPSRGLLRRVRASGGTYADGIIAVMQA